MRHARIATAFAFVFVGLVGVADAAPGDYRLLTGTLVWPQVLLSERLAVVQTDDGSTWFAELASPEGLPRVKAGDRVAVVGREGLQGGQITSASVSPAPFARVAPRPGGSESGDYPSASPSMTSAVPPRLSPTGFLALDETSRAIYGIVDRVSGGTLVVTVNGRNVPVDISGVDTEIRSALARGQEVRVLATAGNGRLVAQGVVIAP